MKKTLWISSLLFAVSTTWAGLVTDEFNRADTVSSTDTSLIGADWEQSGNLNSRWRIGSNTVYSTTTAEPGLMYNTALQTIGGGNGNFTVSVDLASATSNVWAGVAFNYQDDANYYCARFKAGADDYQILARVAGSWTVLKSGHASEIFAFGPDAFYRVKVTSDYAYGFTAEIMNLSTSNTIAQAEAADGAENFSTGYAGLLLSSASTNGTEFARFDNFSLETVAVSSSTFVDDFKRPNTGLTTNSLDIGPNWYQENPNEWTIDASNLVSHVLVTELLPGALYNTTLETVSGNGTNFTVATSVRAQAAGQWVGLAFNYQDKDNFYILRFKGGFDDWQLLRRVGGALGIIKAGHAAVAFTFHDNYYTLTVSSSAPYEFDFTIRETGSPDVLNAVTHAVDANAEFTGGYAAAYAGTRGYAGKFNWFKVTVSTEALQGYAGWATTWGVDIGAEGDDYDNDGLNNLYEYGLKGDPTNALDQGTSPVYAILDDGGTDVFRYVYPQLSDPQSGLSYHLELNTDLAIGSWVDAGYTVEGTNVTGSVLNFVTNTTDLVEGKKFIRLIIE